jgi:hypothetical protein
MAKTWCRALAALAGLGLVISVAVAQGPKQDGAPPYFKQMRLTEKQVQSFITVQKQLAPLSSKLETAEKPDPALQKQIEQIAKSNGFTSLDELADVGDNISIVLAGLDPKTGKFTEPPDLIKQSMEDVKNDKQMSQQDKDRALAEMQDALKSATPLQYKENIALVKKYQQTLDQVLGPEGDKQAAPAK